VTFPAAIFAQHPATRRLARPDAAMAGDAADGIVIMSGGHRAHPPVHRLLPANACLIYS
jgi:hypothetical protein